MNISLGNFLRCLVRDEPHNWELVLAQNEFTYNNFLNRSIGKTHVEIVVGMHPRGILDLTNVVGEEKKVLQGKNLLFLWSLCISK